jgi:RNA-binding protein
LLQVGVLLHQARSGRLVVRLSKELKPGEVILDDKGRKLGRVVELIGPVRSPYASIAVTSSKLGKAGDPAFVNG